MGRKFQPRAMVSLCGSATGVPMRRKVAGLVILILNIAGAVSELRVPKKP